MDVMSLASMYTGMANMQTQQTHQISMMKNAMEQVETMGDQITGMMEGVTVDIKL